MQKSEKTGTVALNGHGWILASFHQTQQMFMEGGRVGLTRATYDKLAHSNCV